MPAFPSSAVLPINHRWSSHADVQIVLQFQRERERHGWFFPTNDVVVVPTHPSPPVSLRKSSRTCAAPSPEHSAERVNVCVHAVDFEMDDRYHHHHPPRDHRGRTGWSFTLNPGKLKRGPRPELSVWTGFGRGCKKLWGGKKTRPETKFICLWTKGHMTRSQQCQDICPANSCLLNRYWKHVSGHKKSCWVMMCCHVSAHHDPASYPRGFTTTTQMPKRINETNTTGALLCDNKDPYFTLSMSLLLTFLTMGCPPCILYTVRTCEDALSLQEVNTCSVWRRREEPVSCPESLSLQDGHFCPRMWFDWRLSWTSVRLQLFSCHQMCDLYNVPVNNPQATFACLSNVSP